MVVVLCVTSVLLSLSDTVLLSLSDTGCCLVCDVCVAVIVRRSGYCLVCDVCVAVIVRHSGCCLVCDVSVLSLSDTVVVVLYVMSVCCHCQTQWLLSCK